MDTELRETPTRGRILALGLSAAIAGAGALLAFFLFGLPDGIRPWIAAGILAAGTLALGGYTYLRLRRQDCMGICPDPECGRAVRPYRPGTAFVPVGSLQMGMRFRIPDLHGEYAWCCLREKPAVYQVVANTAKEFGELWEKYALRCVVCGQETPFGHTTIQVVEVIP